MEKLQTLGLILLGLALFVWRMVQKMRDTTRQEQQERPRAQSQRSQSGSSFEDLLKQMQQQNQRGNAPAAPATTPGGRKLPQEQARAARTLERPAQRALSQERRATNMSLERPAPVARRGTGMDHSQPAHQPRQSPSAAPVSSGRSLTSRLRNPAELRDAFILSEILKRRFE
ncbi:hypothetical protein LGH70_17680 [Hymenobacter sp. BT635]|uniref:Uncharacterized protein n=1 Tax=Hymenobacter nitidus TaxID=2880929 RepID=A0ABS8AKC8_9BACT|nr:hypothetical protein [Hymenobacter nitidus]MCB2379434.1 hypothetical protein [Hymenobacter nitidus]